MTTEDWKNDSRKIFPRINWKENSINPGKVAEAVNQVWKKKILCFNAPKPIMKRSPTNFNLIRTLKLHKEENKNDKAQQTNISIPINNYRNNKINIYTRNILLEKDLSKFLNRKIESFSDRNFKTKKFKQESDIYEIDKINIPNLKEKFSKPFKIKRILIAKIIKDIKSLNKKNSIKRKLSRKNEHFVAFDSPSFNKPFSDITPKSNRSAISLKQITNSREENKKKFQDSINDIESKIFSTHLNKKKKSKKKEIFFWNFNNKSTRNIKKNQTINLSNIEYVKKWGLSKSLYFDKLNGRQGKINNQIKFHYLERLHNFTPKYDSVLCNDSKLYIKYNRELNIEFNQYKKNMIRKFIYNHLNIMNNRGNNYNILNYLNKRKFENQKIILNNKKKNNRIEEKFVYFNKKSNNY